MAITTQQPNNNTPWWDSDTHFSRFICDLIYSELSSSRRSRIEPPLPWPNTLHLVHDIGIDSLELLTLATTIADMVNMYRSGIEDYLLARPTVGDWIEICRQSLRHFSSEITFRTSGSTGTPKRCHHQLSNLWQEIDYLVPMMRERKRILSVVPCHHIYGFLFTVLLPQAPSMDNPAVLDLRASSPAKLASLLREGDLVVAHPEFWRLLLQLRPVIPPSVIGMTSTAPCPDEVVQGLSLAGLDQLIQLYGSTETAGVGWRTSCDLPYTLFPYWRRVDAAEHLIERATSDDQYTQYPIQDQLQWISDRTFQPGSRIDIAVQVAGVNVFPELVAAKLRENPAVREASVRLMRPDEGNRLKAFVVPAELSADLNQLEAQLIGWVRENLDGPQRPTVFSFGQKLPTRADGKLSDWIIDHAAPPAMH